MSRLDIIIDTDPGVDDAAAILAALSSPDINLLGLSVVAGNVPLDDATDNACRIVGLSGRRDVPVHTPVARQQSAWRDLALIVGDAVSHDSLMQAIDAGPQRLIRSAQLFDVYKPAAPTADIPAGKRSLAVRLELLDDAAYAALVEAEQ